MNSVTERYAAYAAAQGRTPDQQIAHDHDVWPASPGSGYILWCRKRWTEWRAREGRPPDYPTTTEDHRRFDEWLAAEL